jgi:hypothetical protein
MRPRRHDIADVSEVAELIQHAPVATGRVSTQADRFPIRYPTGTSCRVVISVSRVASGDG